MPERTLPDTQNTDRSHRLDSCLAAKLSHFITLSNVERDLIFTLEEVERPYRHGAVVWRQRDEATHMYVVKSGWMYSYSVLPDGRRQVVDIYCPGDVLGLRDIVFDYSVHAVVACGDSVLCPFPKSAMDDVFIKSPRLATLLYSLGMLENIAVIDRLKTVARQDARERLCYFLLQIHSKLKVSKALSDKPEPASQGRCSEAFRPPADATRSGRRNGSV